jgi:sulfhydrogenase subunit beta (sulfur reductase)
MGARSSTCGDQRWFLSTSDLDRLISELRANGYVVIGPVHRDGAIIYDEIGSAADLPVGLRDLQAPGSYRVERRGDDAYFGYVVGPHSWKKFLYPPRVRLLSIGKDGKVTPYQNGHEKMAFIGVRSCDLSAIAVLDRVLLQGPYVDQVYLSKRRSVLIVAVDCYEPGANCFCASVGTGPAAKSGFDIGLTEVLLDEQHYFVARVGSEAGLRLLERIGARDATAEEVEKAERLLGQGLGRFVKRLEVSGLKEALYRGLESEAWKAVAERCLACSNCTLVCPTCFCTNVEEVTRLTEEGAERWRRWDSCFTQEFSYIHGGSIRASVLSRYRQWLTHKLAAWIDQFGVLGCVGCGRCITWCPVGIDITVEAERVRASVEGGGR